MKLCIVTSFPYPNGKATANRIEIFASKLSGIDSIQQVEIICCSSNNSYSKRLGEKLIVTNLKIHSIDKNRLIIRAFYEMFSSFRLYFKVKANRNNIVLITVPSVMLILSVFLLPKRLFIILDIRDAVWSYLNKGFFQKLISGMLKLCVRAAINRATLVSVTNLAEAKQVQSITGIGPIIVPNGISLERLHDMQSIKPKSQKSQIKLAYVGNVGIAQNIEYLIDYTREIPNLKVKIIGDGARLNSLKQKCKKEKITSVLFTGFVPFNDIKKEIEDVDILFAQIMPNYATAIPTKIFEYIASGRKILLGIPDGPAKELFLQFNGIETFFPGDKTAFLLAYNRLINVRVSNLEKNQNIHILKEHYLREKCVTPLIKALVSELKSNQNPTQNNKVKS